MADYQEKPGQGAVFSKEKTTPKHPDFAGGFTDLSGKKMQLAMWWKESAKGVRYLSVSVSEPMEQQKPATQTPRPYQPAPKPKPEPEPEEQSDLPF